MSATAPEPAPAVRRTRARLTLAGMSLGFAVVQLDVSVVNVAIRSIGAELGGGIGDLQWVVNAYTLAFAAFILTAGAVVDRIGARRVAVAGFGVFGLASVLCGVAPGLAVLVGARAVQGLAAAGLVPASLTLVNHAFLDPGERNRALALYLTGASLAFAAGPLVGGLLIAGFGWRAIFLINVPLTLLGAGLTVRFATETSRLATRHVDWPGQGLAVIGLGALVGATIEGGQHGFTAPGVLAGFAAAGLAVAAFVLVEHRRAEPMLPLALFARRGFSVPAAVGLGVNVAVYGLLFVLSLFLQRQLGLSPLLTGLGLLPIAGGILAANLVSVRLVVRFGAPRAIAASAALALAGCAALLGVGAGTGYPALVVPFAAIGLGTGTLVPAMTAELMGSVERERSGVAAGTLNTLRQTGSAIGVALFGAFISAGLVAGLRLSLVVSVVVLGVVVAICPLMGATGAGRAPEVVLGGDAGPGEPTD